MGSALGQAHWPPPQAGATSGRWPTVPGVTHLIARAQMGPIRTPGGPPNPRGRVPHQRCSRALVTSPPPVGPCIPAFIPRGADPGPLLCPLAPAMSRLPLLPVPALACWCPWLLALCFFFVLSLSPRRPRPFCGWALEKGAGGGGGILAVLPFAQARRKHGAGTRHGTCPSAGGGGCRVAPVVTLPFLRLHPRWSPRGGLHGACPPWARSSRPSVSPPRRGVPGGGSAARYRHPSCPLAISPLPSPLSLVGAGGGGRGGGVRPRCPSSGVSTSPARHWHAARHLSSCWGVRHAAWPLSLPYPRCVLSPGAPPAGEGGPLPAPPFLQPPPLGGRRLVGGGGLVVFLPLPSRRRHEAWLSSLCRGGGGLASRLPPSPLLSYARTPGGPPAWACTERALYGHGRVARLTPSFLCLPTLPRCPRGGGGGGRFSPPPYPHSPSGGWWWWGGVGRPFRLPSVARTSQACRRHSTTTGQGTWLPRGGGGFPLGLPALFHGKGPALQDHQPLLPPRR